jgi:ribosomal protein S18 acetylase RimI-like enzyme
MSRSLPSGKVRRAPGTTRYRAGCARTEQVSSEPVRIRPYQPDDLDDLYRICLETADNGQDATSLFRDPRLPGHVFAGPYATFEPELAFVAHDPEGVAGYVLGALDSKAFAQRLERDWWPALRASYPEQDLDADTPGLDRYAVGTIHHPWPISDALVSRFPSHLHIDLLPRLQGLGIGKQLIGTLTSRLRDRGSPGLHLFVSLGNQRAVGFYQHLGFDEYPATDARIFTMDLTGEPGPKRPD